MKKGLMLSSNQSMKFNDFFADIQAGKQQLFDYSGYSDLLFVFDTRLRHPAYFINLDTKKKSYEYGGVYATGYTSVDGCTSLAIAVARIMSAEGIPVADSELAGSLSLSKMPELAKLALSGVRIPKTYGGTKIAIIRALTTKKIDLEFPVVFKANNGKRGRDNWAMYSENEIYDFLQDKPDSSIWIMQKMIRCDGFYRLNTYFYHPAYGIYRTNDAEKAGKHRIHMYKPQGGANATFLETKKIPKEVVKIAKKATKATKREFAGVDVVLEKSSRLPYVIEVNTCPQLVTVESFKEERIGAFLKAMKKLAGSRD